VIKVCEIMRRILVLFMRFLLVSFSLQDFECLTSVSIIYNVIRVLTSKDFTVS